MVKYLLENDTHWDTTLAGASNTALPQQTHITCDNTHNVLPIES